VDSHHLDRGHPALDEDDRLVARRSWKAGDFAMYIAELLHDELRDEKEVRLLLRHAPVSRRAFILGQLDIEVRRVREAVARLEAAVSRGVILHDARSASWVERQALLERKRAWAFDELGWTN
jgi:hypothetical protein